MNKKDFARGRIRTNPILAADAYTIAGNTFASEKAKEKSVYNFTNRYSPVDAYPEVVFDDRMLLYGLTDFIRNHLTQRITKEDVDEAEYFMRSAHSFGGQLLFDRTMWDRVVSVYDGYLPIIIEGLPEGSVFFPHEPVIQVTSLDEGFGEIAAHIEALLVGMVSIATARLTLTRHWLERIRAYVGKDTNSDDNEFLDITARFFIHDFGMRASSCAEESEMLGRAHLLVFHGTDTFNAAYQAWKLGAKRPTGTSIPALAHRIVQGYSSELECFNKLQEVSPKIASYVADCYNYKNAITDLISIAQSNQDSIIVARSDSGNLLENDLYTINMAKVSELDNFKIINGDSINPLKLIDVMNQRYEHGFKATECGIFGVGGYLRNFCTRDSLSSAYKLSAVGHELKPVCKLAEHVGKMSVPGPNFIIRPKSTHYMKSEKFANIPTTYFSDESLPPNFSSFKGAYVTYYNGNWCNEERFGDVCIESFSEVQHRVINEFDYYTDLLQGRKKKVLSEKIEDFRQELVLEHKRKF